MTHYEIARLWHLRQVGFLKKWQLPKLSVIPVLKSTKERSNKTQVSHIALRCLIVLADILEPIILSTKKINGWTYAAGFLAYVFS